MGSSIGFRKPKPVLAGCPSGLLRSEPAAGRFKAAMRRYAAALRALAERTRVPRQGSALLGRRSAPLVLRRPDPEAPGLRRFFSTAPEGQPAGAGSIPEGETERTPTMAKTASAPRTAARVVPLRKGTTLEMVRLACPDVSQATRISESFGLPVLDSDGIREAHHRLIVETADALSEGLGERAMQIHLQRIASAFVSSAYGAGQFYSRAVSEARDATAKAACDARDEDIDGPVGFDGAAQRKREFAADMGVQAHALRMASEGGGILPHEISGMSQRCDRYPSIDRKRLFVLVP